jgi:hypothetical protein
VENIGFEAEKEGFEPSKYKEIALANMSGVRTLNPIFAIYFFKNLPIFQLYNDNEKMSFNGISKEILLIL